MPVSRCVPDLVAVVCIAMLMQFAGSALAAGRAPEPEIPDTWPKWLKKDMKQESRRKKTQPVVLGDGLITTRVIGKIDEPPEALDDGWNFSADIGGDDPMVCWIQPGTQDLANELEELQQLFIDSSAEANAGKLERKSPYHLDSGVLDESPFLVSEWLFVIAAEGGPQIGLTKARVARKDGVTFACVHLGLGYRKTFERVFETLVTDAVIKIERAAPYYREIVLLSLGNMPAGVATTEFTLDEDGDSRIDIVSTMLMRIDANTLVASDNRKIEYSTPDGAVINAYDFILQNGEYSTNLALARSDESGWSVEGSFGGKDIALAVDADQPPLSALGQMLAVRNALRTDDGKTQFKTWLSDADPSKFLEASIVIGERGDAHHEATLLLGPMVLDANVDDAGSLVSASLAMGANTIKMERVFVSGSVADPPAE